MWVVGVMLALAATAAARDRSDVAADLPSLVFGDDTLAEQDRQAYGGAGSGQGIVNYLISAQRPSRTSGYGNMAGGGAAAGGAGAPAAATRLQDACTSNADCGGVADSTCINGQCLCGTGFVPLDRIACVARAGFLGDTCVISEQCAQVDANAVCYKDRCVCEPLYYVASTLASAAGDNYNLFSVPTAGAGGVGCVLKKRLREACADNRECKYHTWDSRCINGVCACRAGFAPVGDHLCATKAINLGDPCAVDSQCLHIALSECKREGICWCRDNDTSVSMLPVVATGTKAGRLLTRIGRQAGNRCLSTKNLGQACTVNDECAGKVLNSACTSGTCQCGNGFTQLGNLNQCLTSALAFNATCVISQQCGSGLICNSTTQTCGCNHMTQCTTTTSTCLSLVAFGASCTDSCQCTTVGATCTGGVCACTSTQNFSATNNTCTNRVCNLSFSRDNYVCQVTDGCCRTTGSFIAAIGIFACQVAPSSETTESSFGYTIADTTRFTILANGSIYLNNGQNVNSLVSTTVTVTSNSDSTCTDTVPIEFMGESCCQQPATVDNTQTALVFTVADVVADGNAAGTNCDPATAPNMFTNPLFDALTQMIRLANGMQMAMNVYTNLPCGSTTLATAVISETIDASMVCMVNAATTSRIDGIFATVDTVLDTALTAANLLGTMATVSCMATITGTTCNGVTVPTATITLTFTCTDA